MKTTCYLAYVAIAIISILPLAVTAQEDKTIKSSDLENNDLAALLNLEEGQYFADRDSAYVDPYYGLKKLIYGNKRFAENKSIRPRQTDEDLKNNKARANAFCHHYWLCRQPGAQ